ncbi:carbohydrate ABC transporter membrane protein 1, CUT1 family [Quadrisphaera granulorum]|uniref:Carbohydrate ABC transporter membrane protein 1 (CUT1 family) n=1 Tax=Quadrisphaera granulorum TaxID=317664 RepID=A0A316AD96_9ACTN|nr:carbohydrate ABC transporter membrane protein 1 (CUT1 family) [Quadrisphaera granulorum]SZE95727.1 carbohydrate ABC transporter membrane protein 1, CUT1 family [Quadrisphaera granulorum]
MALPALLFFAFFGGVPLVGVVLLSFTQWDGIGAISWLGIGNWTSVLADPVMWKAMGLTFGIMVFSWAVQTPLALLLGVFTAGTQKYRAFLAVLYFLPLLMSAAAISIAFKALLDPNFGLAATLGIPILVQNWLGSPTLVLFVVIFVLSWMYVPFHSLIYQGGARQIPKTMYEAASIDGAGTVRQFFSITLPQLKHTIITSSTLMVVGSMTTFDLIWILTAGGPGNATRVLAVDMYLRGFRANEMGPASVIAVLIVLIGLLLAQLLQRLGGKDKTSSQMEGM